MSSFKNNIVNTIAYSFLDVILNKFIKLGAELLVLNLLSKDEIGLWGIAGSYLVFINYMMLTPESILLKDYQDYKDDKKKKDQIFTSFINFSLFRNFVIVLIGVIIAIVLAFQNQILAITFFCLLLQKLFIGFQEMIKLKFYVNFKQSFVTRVTFFQNLTFLASLTILFVSPSLYTFTAILVLTDLFFTMGWIGLLKTKLDFKYQKNKSDWINLTKHNIKSFTFWQHLNGTTTNLMYNIDPWVLSFFVSTAIIGEYTIGLKFSNYFFILPMILQKSTTLHFSHKLNMENTEKVLMKYIGLFFLVSAVQLGGYLVFGRFVLDKMFREGDIDFIFSITTFILIGISVLNIARPFIALISVHYSLKKSFFQIYLPTVILGIVNYFLMAKYFGVKGVAVGNIFNYLFMFLLLLTFYLRNRKVFSRKV
jgi:O-antigen/teichoic acid export membrane protein